MKKVVFIFIAFTIHYSSYAQFAETIVSARPGISNGSFGVGKDIYQVQSGLNFNRTYFEQANEKYNIRNINNNSIFRIGVAEQTELRAGFGLNFHNEFKIAKRFTESIDNGFTSFLLGIRQNISSQNGIIPAFGLQFTTTLGAWGDYRRNKNNYELRFLFQHRLNELAVINTNYALEYNHQLDNLFSRYVVSYQHMLTNELRLVVEAYGTIDDGNTDLLFNTGLGYLVNNDFQLDAFVGYDIDKSEGLTPKTKSYFISFGISYRINKRN